MARSDTLPDQARAVEHLPTSLPAVQVTLPDAVGDHIVAAAEHIAPHVPDWFSLTSAATAADRGHAPTEIPPPPPVDVTLPPDAAAPAHLTGLPEAARIPDWLFV
jgi:hypothetical protein